MLEFITGAFAAVVQFLGSLLPDSPFADMTLPEGIGDGLGWLNWVVPFQSFLVMLGLWAAGLAAYVAVKFILRNSLGKLNSVSVR